MAIDATPEGGRRIRVIRNKMDYGLDIADIGFGIAQILPVIVQALIAPQHSITVIEQPEVHLDPNMQAILADIFMTLYTRKSIICRKGF